MHNLPAYLPCCTYKTHLPHTTPADMPPTDTTALPSTCCTPDKKLLHTALPPTGKHLYAPSPLLHMPPLSISMPALLLLLFYLPTTLAHGGPLWNASELAQGSWSAPGPWAKRGAEFTGNSPLAATSAKSNSDACLSQGQNHMHTGGAVRGMLLVLARAAELVLAFLLPLLVSTWYLWSKRLRWKRCACKMTGYRRGGTAQTARRHNWQRWGLRWTTAARCNNVPRPQPQTAYGRAYGSLSTLAQLIVQQLRCALNGRIQCGLGSGAE